MKPFFDAMHRPIRFLWLSTKAALATFMATLLLAGATQAAEPVLGVDYIMAQQQLPVKNPKKIAVVEFFWYGCPHCYALHPEINAWKKTIPNTVSFEQTPVVFSDAWLPGARAHYTMKKLGVWEQLNDSLFKAIHEKGLDSSNDRRILDWLIDNSKKPKKEVLAAYYDFRMNEQLTDDRFMAETVGITGVPTILVDGKYLVLSRNKSQGTVTATVNALLQRVAKERGIALNFKK